MQRVLIFGDSNSFGTAPMRNLASDGIHPRGVRWGDVMAGELGAGFEVIIEGLPGRTTVHDDPIEGAYRNGLRSMRAILESHRPIDLLIFGLGTNDAKQRFRLGTQDIALGVTRLLKEAQALRIVRKYLVVCPPPVREIGELGQIFAGAEARCSGLSGEMKQLAEANRAAFFDAGEVISVDETDGVHWSAQSHGTLGRAMAPVVQALLK